MSDTLILDFETRAVVDIKSAGADVYARDPFTRVLCTGYAFNDEDIFVTHMGQMPEPAVLDHVAEGKPVIAHNFPFEFLVWNYVLRREFPEIPELKTEQGICTMAMAYSMSLPGSLENAAAAAGLDAHKDSEGRRIMLQLAQPRDMRPDGTPIWWENEDAPEKFLRLHKYCAQDILVERALYKRLVNLSKREKEIWNLDFKINQRGVSIDLKACENAIKIVELEKKRLDLEMQKVTKGAVGTCGAVAQLMDWLKDNGVFSDGVAKGDVADLLADPNMPEDCKRALLLRQEAAKSSNAKLSAMMKSVCSDGRARGLFQYHGAGTGRWAGRRIQLQNLPRNKIPQADINSVFNILRGISE